MATRRLLQDTGLLEDIFDFVGESLSDRPIPRNRALLRILLTCRTFRDVGLKVMWKELHSPLPLFRLLPLRLVDDRYVSLVIASNSLVILKSLSRRSSMESRRRVNSRCFMSAPL